MVWVDSTVLIHVMTTLNKRYDYGLDLVLLSIDEGIRGSVAILVTSFRCKIAKPPIVVPSRYRDDSLATVHRNRDQYDLPLEV